MIFYIMVVRGDFSVLFVSWFVSAFFGLGQVFIQ